MFAVRVLDILSLIFILASWSALPAFVHGKGVGPLNATLCVLIFNSLLIGLAARRNMVWSEEDGRAGILGRKEKERAAASEEFEKVKRFERGMRDKESLIVNLYEITKKMSEFLKFEDIFDAFSIFLRENFEFRRCELIILKAGDGAARSDRVFTVWRDGRSDSGETRFNRDKFIKIFFEKPRETYLSAQADPKIFKDLEVADEAVTTLAGIPLLSEKKLVGILAMENLPKEDLERFTILAIQFALEIKKVLLYETVERLAITDSLTGLYVRRYFSERLGEEAQRSKRYKLKFALIMIDIDNFKNCNDTYGHLVGDVILRDMARIMRENTRQIDIIARYGGEEFSIVLPETAVEGAVLAAERIRKKIEEHEFRAYDEKLKITVSAGVSVYPADAQDAKTLIDKADAALYAAKKSGKNVVCEYKK